jgi:hypothetical protein
MPNHQDPAKSRQPLLPLSETGQQLMLEALRAELGALQAVLAQLPTQPAGPSDQQPSPTAADDLFDNMPV